MVNLGVALLAIAVLGVEALALDDVQAWHNDTTNTSSSSSTEEEDGWMTIFAPITMRTQLSLEMAEGPSTYAPVPSPMTAVTQLSLEEPKPEETGASGHGSSDRKPIIQPTGVSLILPITNADGSETIFVTVDQSSALEHPGSIIVLPVSESSRPLPTPKVAHTEVAATDLDVPPVATKSATRQENLGPSETGTPENTRDAEAQTQHQQSGDQDSRPTDSPATESGETEAPRTILISGTPVVAGGSPATIDGETISLAPTGSVVVINGATIPFSTNARGQIEPAGTAAEASQAASLFSAASVEIEATASDVEAQATENSSTAEETGTGSETTSSSNSQGTSPSDDASSSSSGTASSDASSAEQTDNAGAMLSVQVTAMLGAVGVLAVVAL